MKRALPSLIAGGIIVLVYAYPGLLTLDSTDQLTEGRAGFYTDAHPPLMNMLWGLLDHIVAGPLLMLVLQVATFFAGSYLLLKRVLSPRAAGIAASALALFPPILVPMSFIWKDSLMAGLLVLATGLVTSPCRRARIGSVACFLLASAVKYNAFVATLPLVVLLFEIKPGLPWLKRYAISAATWVAITGVAMTANSALVDQPMHYWHSSLATADITGVIANMPTTSDDELKKELAGTQLVIDHDIQARARLIYASRGFQSSVTGDLRMWDLPVMGRVPAPEAQRDAIACAWWRLVTGHPGAYLKHRFDIMTDILGITYKTQSAVPPRIMRYPGFLTQIGLSATAPRFQLKWTAAYRWLWRHTPLFTQWIFVLLALALLWLARRQRTLLALLASGLCAEASLFVLGPSPDFRYTHWTIVCACYAAVMLGWQAYERAAAARGTAGTQAASPRA